MKSLVLFLAFVFSPVVAETPLVLTLQTRSSNGETMAVKEQWLPSHTAIIVCDMWDFHHCKNAVIREGEMAPRMNELLEKSRAAGVFIIHAPSGCMKTYEGTSARGRAKSAPTAARLPDKISEWCRQIPAEEQAVYPIDQTDSEDDDPAEHAKWAKELEAKGLNPRAPWTKQTDMLRIDQEKDAISDSGVEIWNLLEERGISNVILTGVHVNMCVAGRPFGLRQMAKNGRHVVLMRDLTDSMYNPQRWPFVSHARGTELFIEHVEKYICPTITSDQFLGGQPFAFTAVAGPAASQSSAHSCEPMRPLPVAMKPPLAAGPQLFVDAARGDDAGAGSEKAPWKTLAHALRQLKPGDTLYLRGGTFYEKVAPVRSGTAEAPITISSFPGELAIIDGGLREFAESPATSWEPLAGGAEGEFVSTKTFPHADARRAPSQFLPASWEPMWGIEDERPLALGNFADSMVPLHGYRNVVDLRATSEFWIGGKKEKETGIYCGPGLWFNRETARIHIRLAHHKLDGLGDHTYRGETDPRKLPLVIALGFGEDVLRVSGVKHVRLQNLVLRGATGSPMVHIYGSEDIALDHVTIFGGFPGLLVNASKDIRVTHSAFRGLAAPWSSRAHMKYRGTASYEIVLRNDQPGNENIEFAWCEFTDDHDFAFLRYAKNLHFHHNFVDNFNDDGLECGPKLRSHTIFIHENRIGACLSPFTQHEGDKDESPLDHDPKAGVFVFRNVIDLRAGTFRTPPAEADPSGSFLHYEGHLVGDHGGPIWTVMHVYHNTVLRQTPVFRDYFLFGLGAQGLRNTERDVFNNILVQFEKVPGVGFAGIKDAGNLREGGNILWGVKEGAALAGDPFAKFRASALFEASKKFQEPGWTTLDRVADPKFTSLTPDSSRADDLRLQSASPAVDSGVAVPAEWPDPLRAADKGAPDIGALPLGAKPWSVGVDGRIPLFGSPAKR